MSEMQLGDPSATPFQARTRLMAAGFDVAHRSDAYVMWLWSDEETYPAPE